jgi:hypothetical protein
MSKIAKVCGMVALALVASASAQQTGLQSYDVELIVFRTLATKATPEEWRLEAGSSEQPAATAEADSTEEERVAAPAPSAPLTAFPALPQAKFKLSAIADTLRRSRNYQPLAHFGWTQPGFPRGDARYLSIGELVPASSGLAGQIALSRGRYLHLTLDLTFDSPEEGGQRMVMRQTRRMRSNERHYIDHPKFGVIAVITPSGAG